MVARPRPAALLRAFDLEQAPGQAIMQKGAAPLQSLLVLPAAGLHYLVASFKPCAGIHGLKLSVVSTMQVAVQMEPPPEILLPLLPYQKEFLAWGVQQERGTVKGGILADE